MKKAETLPAYSSSRRSDTDLTRTGAARCDRPVRCAAGRGTSLRRAAALRARGKKCASVQVGLEEALSSGSKARSSRFSRRLEELQLYSTRAVALVA